MGSFIPYTNLTGGSEWSVESLDRSADRSVVTVLLQNSTNFVSSWMFHSHD